MNKEEVGELKPANGTVVRVNEPVENGRINLEYEIEVEDVGQGSDLVKGEVVKFNGTLPVITLRRSKVYFIKGKFDTIAITKLEL
jgi:hypothetical protein